MSTIVYFLGNRRNGHIKIGITKNLEQRVPQIRIEQAHGAGIVVLGIINGGREVERFLHFAFQDFRVGNSEWFAPAPPLVDLIKEISIPFDGCTEYRDTHTFYGQNVPAYGYNLYRYEVPIYDNPLL
jgi:hypothetical protein